MVDTKLVSELIISAQEGDEFAFNELYASTSEILFNQVKEIISDDQIVQDIVQDTYIKVLESKMKNSDNGLSYLITIARNLAINAYNRRKREVFLISDEFESIYKFDYFNRNESYIEDIMNKCLSSYQIDLIKKHVIEGFTHVEIAKMLNKPVGTIMWQYNEALKEIRKFLKNND